MVKYLREKIMGGFGSASGFASILGSWQICHNICLGIIALLSIFGITIVGLPFLFFNKIAVYVWSVAVLLLIITFIIYIKKKCISGKLLLLNLGLIIAGIPFQKVQDFIIIFWILGGLFVLTSIILFIKDKRWKK